MHTYSLDVSAGGTLATGCVQDGGYMVYNISYVEETPVAPALREGEWQSSCGTVVTSKFCPECGNKF